MAAGGREKDWAKDDERRSDVRLVNVLQFATIQDQLGCHPCLVMNIGVGGLQVRLHRMVDLIGTLTVELRGDFRIAGDVAWRQNTTVGIQFLEELTWSSVLAVAATAGPRSRAPRLPLKLRIMARWGARLVPVMIRNITPAGARLQIGAGALDERNMTLSIPGVGPRGAQIRWHNEREMGVLFHHPLLGHELASLLNTTSQLQAVEERRKTPAS